MEEDDAPDRTPQLYRTLPDQALDHDRAVHTLRYPPEDRCQGAGTVQARRSLGAPGKASPSPPRSTPHRSRHRRRVVGGEAPASALGASAALTLRGSAPPGSRVAGRPGALFRHAGRSRPKQRRRRPHHPGARARHTGSPNEVWRADFTGQCRPGDGLYGSPLPVAGASARDRLGCAARLSPTPVEAPPLCARLFRADGVPGARRTDNGAPLATPALCGLATLRVWWITRGRRHQRIAPGRPEQNGRHARRHRALKAGATRPPARHQTAQQARCARCGQEGHHERPHEARGQRPPAAL
jgi:hypothetical protein